jgi:hypothetical protein
MKTPIEMMLDGMTWVSIDDAELEDDGTYPYATHEGVLTIGKLSIKCYKLSNGKRVIAPESIEYLLFAGIESERWGDSPPTPSDEPKLTFYEIRDRCRTAMEKAAKEATMAHGVTLGGGEVKHWSRMEVTLAAADLADLYALLWKNHITPSEMGTVNAAPQSSGVTNTERPGEATQPAVAAPLTPSATGTVVWRVGTQCQLKPGAVWLDRGHGTGSCIATCFKPELAQFIVDACNAYESQGHRPSDSSKCEGGDG